MKYIRKTKEELIKEIKLLKKENGKLRRLGKKEEKLEQALDESSRLYQELINLSPEAILLHVDGKIIYANLAAAELFGLKTKNEMIGKKLLSFVPKKFKNIICERINSSSNNRLNEPLLIKGKRKNGSEFHLEAVASVVPYDSGKAVQVIIRDITRQVKYDNELRESESRYRSLVELSPEAIIVHSKGKIMYANKAASNLIGQPENSLIGMDIVELAPPEYRDKIRRKIQLGEKGEVSKEPIMLTAKMPDGSIRYFETVGAPIKIKGKPAAQVIIRDITANKLYEDSLKNYSEHLRNLNIHLQKVREEERTKVAREIHDELGQNLTALAMDISLLKELAEETVGGKISIDILKKLDSTSKLLEDTVSAVRKISSELRPSVLDSLGLLAAIEWQAEEFEKRMGITCECFLLADNVKLAPEITTGVFRILQESLTNIAKHSKASLVTITFTEEKANYFMEIKDNGIGISEFDFEKQNSFGLIGMHERANLFGGEVEIKGIQGKGTTVSVRIPFDK